MTGSSRRSVLVAPVASWHAVVAVWIIVVPIRGCVALVGRVVVVAANR